MEYLKPLAAGFNKHANAERALKTKNYVRGQFDFYGLDAKTRRQVQKEFFKDYGYPKRENLFEVVKEMWKLPERDFQHCAIDILQKFSKELAIDDIDTIEELIVSKSWWDSVDGLATWICASYFRLYPDQIKPVTKKWMDSGNFWLQRSCLLFQLKYKENTDTLVLEQLVSKLHNHKEFFIRKAIGWILREYSKTNPAWVKEFLIRQELSPLSYKEASKYL